MRWRVGSVGELGELLFGDPFFDAFSVRCVWQVGGVDELDALASWKGWRVGRVAGWGPILVRFCEQRYEVMTEFDRRFPSGFEPYGFGPYRVGLLDVVRLGCWCVGLLACWR